MPIITRTEVEAYAHCAQQVDDDAQPSFDHTGMPSGLDRCKGYQQVTVRAIRETIGWTYFDGNGGVGSSPLDVAIANNVERSTERLTWLDPADQPCPYCGFPRELSEQVRPVYANLGGARGGPDQIFRDRRAAREQVAAAVSQASAAERTAAALEEANALKARELALREREREQRASLPPAKRRPVKVDA